MWIGPNFSLQLYGAANSNDDRTGGSALLGYGTQYGVAFTFEVPLVLTENHPSNSEVNSPRIGAIPSGRMTGNFLFRIWGDAADYLIFSLGVGLPFQSSGALQNGPQATWALPATVQGRVEIGDFAILPTFSLTSTFGTTNTSANGTLYYSDPTNPVSATIKGFYYLNTFTAPFIAYTEAFPARTDYGTDNGASTFIYNQASSGRTRSFTVGSDYYLNNSHFLFTLQGTYYFLGNVNYQDAWAGTGTVRCLF
jgi:hypothetical protein